MIKKLRHKVQPKQGFAHYFYLAFALALPVLVLVLVRFNLELIALAVIILSKWRIIAIKPRHWFAHLRTNAVDIIFSLSILAFMIDANSLIPQIALAAVYEIWVLFIKPRSSALFVSVQALIAQFVGLTAIYNSVSIGSLTKSTPLSVLILGTGVIMYFCARHFFGSFEERDRHIYSWTWTLFGASLAWLLGHWLLFYGPVAQPAILLSVVGASIAALYYFSEVQKLSRLVQRQIVAIALVTITLLLIFSDWTGTSV